MEYTCLIYDTRNKNKSINHLLTTSKDFNKRCYFKKTIIGPNTFILSLYNSNIYLAKCEEKSLIIYNKNIKYHCVKFNLEKPSIFHEDEGIYGSDGNVFLCTINGKLSLIGRDFLKNDEEISIQCKSFILPVYINVCSYKPLNKLPEIKTVLNICYDEYYKNKNLKIRDLIGIILVYNGVLPSIVIKNKEVEILFDLIKNLELFITPMFETKTLIITKFNLYIKPYNNTEINQIIGNRHHDEQIDKKDVYYRYSIELYSSIGEYSIINDDMSKIVYKTNEEDDLYSYDIMEERIQEVIDNYTDDIKIKLIIDKI